MKSQPDRIFFCPLYEESPSEFLLGIKHSKQAIKRFRKKFKLTKQWMDEKFELDNDYSLPTETLTLQTCSPYFSKLDLDFLQLPHSLMIINKPPGMHSHPLGYSEPATVLNFLRKNVWLGDFPKYDQEKGLLYRLDGVTSGLLVYCRDYKTHEVLRKNFHQIAIEKNYLAIVEGQSREKTRTLRKKFSDFSSDSQSGPKWGEIKFEVLATNQARNLSLLSITLCEGHRHQIRKQLADANLPILGDELYGGTASQRVFLHCYRYTFAFPWGEQTFQAALGSAWADLFDLDRGLEMFGNQLSVF